MAGLLYLEYYAIVLQHNDASLFYGAYESIKIIYGYRIIIMPSGLMQIATYGSQDLFLTGTPEITFFKVVYRRHTNFSMESIVVTFDDPVEFGGTSTVKVPKVGDLMYKTYLAVTLPEINLFRQTVPTTQDIGEAQTALTDANNNYTTVTNFMYINRNAFANAYQIYIAENNTENTSNDMIQAVNSTFNQEGNVPIVDAFSQLLTLSTDAPFTYNEVSLDVIANEFDLSSDSTDIYNALVVGIDKSIKTQQFYYNQFLAAQNTLTDLQNPNIEFAWVDRIGHALINSIEIRIGGHKIDKHYGDWINIWYELTANRDMQKIYFQMIGNVTSLTTFSRAVKPSYLLKIPLQFWFCRYSGLAIPLVALEYHNISVYVNFKRFEELCYIEPGTNIIYAPVNGGITLNEVPDELGVQINANLLIDYIYLDSAERRRFAQSSHEYLIDQLQNYDQTNVVQQKLQVQLNNFVHPSKEVVWVAQRSSFTMNTTGTNQCRWDNYSATVDNTINPIIFSSMDFHSYTRIRRLDGNYFNYLQPYETHNTTPSDGINMYSFSLFPEEQQPSGSANLSRLDRITLYLEFTSLLISNNLIYDPLIVRIYTRNINVLRFVAGMSGLAFVYG